MNLSEYYIHNRDTDDENDIKNAFISFNKKLGYVNFSKQAKNLLSLKQGDKVVIVQHKITRQWKIFKTLIEAGYNINYSHRKGGKWGVRLHCRILVYNFFYVNDIAEETATYLLKKTNDTQAGFPVFALERAIKATNRTPVLKHGEDGGKAFVQVQSKMNEQSNK